MTQELTDAPSPSSPTPGLDLEFDPRTMTLRWNCQENATRATCRLSHREMGDIKVNAEAESCQCTFTRVALHGGATLKVSTTVDGAPVQEELPFSNPGGQTAWGPPCPPCRHPGEKNDTDPLFPGAEGTAARNFSCAIYNAAFMNCTWAPGPAAPSDVQYSLYMRQLKANSESNETECPHYTPDSGTHRGCHLRDISKLKYRTFFLVNGTSWGTEIQFFDLILSTREMEQISPPDNISVQCNASHCVLQWNQPRTKTYLTYLDFQYQLGIRTQNTERARGDNSVINVSGEVHNLYHLPSPEPRGPHSLRIRAADSRGGPWGHWSRPVEFGSRGQEGGLLHVYLLVVLGTLVCALVLGFLLNRSHGLRRLFPPIPQVKDKVTPNDQVDHQVDWAHVTTGAGKDDLEDVLTVQEVN
uniref:Fibronectin type-III domain-containing protein n=1 Tax=Marmota marmota marmota TaxID=9994 RepID=A0A8C5YW16_MARMA